MKTTTLFVVATILAYAQVTTAGGGRKDEAEVYIMRDGDSGPTKIEAVERFGNFNFGDDFLRKRRRGRVPAPDFHGDPKPLPLLTPLPSPSGPCNIPIVKLAAIKKKCRRKLFTPWVEVSLFTRCFTRTYFIRWKFCYKKKICERRVARFRKCFFPGVIACQKTEDLTCPTFVVMRCSRAQPTELITPKIPSSG